MKKVVLCLLVVLVVVGIELLIHYPKKYNILGCEFVWKIK